MNSFQSNLRAAQARWGKLSQPLRRALREITKKHEVSVAASELLYLNDAWYVTHAGLLQIARRCRCSGIAVEVVAELSNASISRWVFKATVYTSRTCRGFSGFGDADPSNVSSLVRGAELRVAETRAVNRALRKAYGVGICSIEEIGSSFCQPADAVQASTTPVPQSGLGSRPLRDRLCLLVRQHRLDAALVKAYATDFCDVAELRLASRERVSKFITHLAEYAQRDRDGLLCQLNSYARKGPTEALVQIATDSGGESGKSEGAA